EQLKFHCSLAGGSNPYALGAEPCLAEVSGLGARHTGNSLAVFDFPAVQSRKRHSAGEVAAIDVAELSGSRDGEVFHDFLQYFYAATVRVSCEQNTCCASRLGGGEPTIVVNGRLIAALTAR